MFVGHYAASLVAKRISPEVPLGVLFLSAQIVDVFWAIFVVFDIEHLRIIPGFTQSNALDLYYMPYTHSLLAVFCWSAGFALLMAIMLKSCQTKSAFLMIAFVVVSHWLTDLIVHIPDLPLFGNEYKQGFGLWQHRELALFVELSLLLFATVYLAKSELFRSSPKLLWAYCGLLCMLQFVFIYGPVPQEQNEMAISAMLLFILFSIIAQWLELATKRKVRDVI